MRGCVGGGLTVGAAPQTCPPPWTQDRVPGRSPGPRPTPAAPTLAFKDIPLCPWQVRLTVYALSDTRIVGTNLPPGENMPKEHSSWLSVFKHFQKPGDKTTSSLLCTSCCHPTCAGVQSAAEPRLQSLHWSAPLSSSAVSTEQSVFPQNPLWSTGAWS